MTSENSFSPGSTGAREYARIAIATSSRHAAAMHRSMAQRLAQEGTVARDDGFLNEICSVVVTCIEGNDEIT